MKPRLDDGNYALARLARGIIDPDIPRENDMNTILEDLIPKTGLKDNCVRNEENLLVHIASTDRSVSFFLGHDAKLRCYGTGICSTIDLNDPNSHRTVWNIIKTFYVYDEHPMERS